MTQQGEAFLDRWSRLKQEREKAATADAPEAPARAAEVAPRADAAPALPPLEELKPDSDFTPFMSPGVDGATRRAALKKLFADAHFNAPDAFEPYSADFTGGEPIPAQMLAAINRVRDVAQQGGARRDEEEGAAPAAQADEAGAPGPEAASARDAGGDVPSPTSTPKAEDVAPGQDA